MSYLIHGGRHDGQVCVPSAGFVLCIVLLLVSDAAKAVSSAARSVVLRVTVVWRWFVGVRNQHGFETCTLVASEFCEQ